MLRKPPGKRQSSATPLLRRKSHHLLRMQSLVPSPYTNCLVLVKLSANVDRKSSKRLIPRSSSAFGMARRTVRKQQVHIDLCKLLDGKSARTEDSERPATFRRKHRGLG